MPKLAFDAPLILSLNSTYKRAVSVHGYIIQHSTAYSDSCYISNKAPSSLVLGPAHQNIEITFYLNAFCCVYMVISQFDRSV